MFPLQSLKQAIIGQQPISLIGNSEDLTLEFENVEKADTLVVNGTSIPLNSSTNFIDQNNQNQALKDIIFCWLCDKLSIVEYKEACAKHGASEFKFLVKTELNTWLLGNSDQCKFVSDLETNGATAMEVDGTGEGEITSNVFEVPPDHNSNLHGTKPVDFSYLIKDAKLLISQLKKNKPTTKHEKKSLKSPIVLVSPSTSALISLGNIKEFLENSQFVDPNSTTVTKPANGVVTITHKSDKLHASAHTITVVDNVDFFTKPEYWDRVVAIFTTGQNWQFSKYKYTNPELLFQKYWGVYVCYGTDVVPKQVVDWNARIIRLDRDKRFRDKMVVNDFWADLEKVLIQRGYSA